MRVMREIPPPSFPHRPADAHKGLAGHLLVIGGSVGLSGAPRLAACGGAAIGAGLVSVMVPAPIRAEVASDPGLMVRGARSTVAGTLAWPALGEVRDEIARRSAVVVGPGAGRHPGTDALMRRIVSTASQPVVCDADALNAWADDPSEVSDAPRVFTPHPGEAARLLGTTSSEVQADRAAAVDALHARLGGVVVLKGADTLVADGNDVYRNPTGNPGLATGGSGDVLAGVIGGLLAQGASLLEAACAGVWVHGLAADEARGTTGERGMTPGALLDQLPLTLGRLEG